MYTNLRCPQFRRIKYIPNPLRILKFSHFTLEFFQLNLLWQTKGTAEQIKPQLSDISLEIKMWLVVSWSNCDRSWSFTLLTPPTSPLILSGILNCTSIFNLSGVSNKKRFKMRLFVLLILYFFERCRIKSYNNQIYMFNYCNIWYKVKSRYFHKLDAFSRTQQLNYGYTGR